MSSQDGGYQLSEKEFSNGIECCSFGHTIITDNSIMKARLAGKNYKSAIIKTGGIHAGIKSNSNIRGR